MPLAIGKMSPAEVQIWQLLATVNTIILLIDIGISSTYSRLFSRSIQLIASNKSESNNRIDWAKIKTIWGSLIYIYKRVMVSTAVLMILLSVFGIKPAVDQLPDPSTGWIAIIVYLASVPATQLGMAQAALIVGVNQVSILRRWEAITGVGGIVTSIIVLLKGGGLLGLSTTSLFWSTFGVLRNFSILKSISKSEILIRFEHDLDKKTWNEAWPSIWKSSLGAIQINTFSVLSGFIYTQFGRPADVATYLISLRCLTAVSQFSQAPFYSKLTTLSQLQHTRDYLGLKRVAKSGMRLANFSFCLGTLGCGFGLPIILRATGQHIELPPPACWWLLAFALFFERIGAMYLQLYSTTNDIKWHIATGISGAIMFALMLLIRDGIGMYVFPLSMFLGYFGFYTWYSVRLSCKEFSINLWHFEKSSGILVLIIMVLGAVFQILQKL
jgi:hypothetical protein